MFLSYYVQQIQCGSKVKSNATQGYRNNVLLIFLFGTNDLAENSFIFYKERCHSFYI